MRIQDKITAVQDQVLESFNSRLDVPKKASILFNKIRNSNLTSLNEVGVSLQNYFNKINDHPEVFNSIDEDFLNSINDYLWVKKSEENKEIILSQKNKIRVLNRISPRFIADKQNRRKEREVKNQIHHINLKQMYNLGDNGYFNFPDNFDMYVRGNDVLVKKINTLEFNAKVFKKQNMEEVAKNINSRISDLAKIEKYLGFYKMKPDEAAIILSKVYDLPFHEWNFVLVNLDFFAQPYWIERSKEGEDSQLKRLTSAKDKKIAAVESSAFLYQPRLYPLHKFENIPNKVEKTISQLEILCDGYPVFDYYWVIVPSININHHYFKTKDEWKIKVRDVMTFTDEYSAAFALDQALIEDGHFTPIVLGERNGVCYFITIWN